MRSHPAADLFPMLGEAELHELAEDIREHGLQEQIVRCDHDGEQVILDGRNRFRACEMAGVEPAFRDYFGADPIGFSIRANLKRRHLTTGQKAMLALKVEPLYAAEAKKAQQEHAGTAPGRPKESLGADLHQVSSEPRKTAARGMTFSKPRAPRAAARAASSTGTSGRSVAQAKRVAEKAPNLAEQVIAGTLAIDRADRIIRDREAEARRVEQAKAQRAHQEAGTRVEVRHGDFREVLADLTNVDAIITDPPYPREFLPLLADLASWADKVLTPDGVLAVLFGQSHLPEVYRLLDGYRPYRWTMSYLTPGAGYSSHAGRCQSNWKPVLVYGGGPRFGDVLRSEAQDAGAKALHEWGQDYGAFHTLVERLTLPGQTVVDPFAGSGTTLLAAQALGRHAIGAELDPDHAATAARRVGLA